MFDLFIYTYASVQSCNLLGVTNNNTYIHTNKRWFLIKCVNSAFSNSLNEILLCFEKYFILALFILNILSNRILYVLDKTWTLLGKTNP